jgi:hypothetical protein
MHYNVNNLENILFGEAQVPITHRLDVPLPFAHATLYSCKTIFVTVMCHREALLLDEESKACKKEENRAFRLKS